MHQLLDSWEPYMKEPTMKWALGVQFYARLFKRHPELVPLFKGAKMDSLSKHFGESLEQVVNSFGDMWNVRKSLFSAALNRQAPVSYMQHSRNPGCSFVLLVCTADNFLIRTMCGKGVCVMFPFDIFFLLVLFCYVSTPSDFLLHHLNRRGACVPDTAVLTPSHD